MRLFLLRHAESVGNKNRIADSIIDSELSEKGKKDAKKLIPILASNKYDVFIVSPLQRTIKTIEPFLNTLESPKVIVEPLTIERNLGKFVGSPKGTFTKYCEENSFEKVFCKPPNGETIKDVFIRAQKVLDALKEKHSDKTILICGHKIFLHCLTLILTNQPIEQYYLKQSLINGEIKEFAV